MIKSMMLVSEAPLLQPLPPLPPWALTDKCPNPYFNNGTYSNGAIEYSVTELAAAAKDKPPVAVPMIKLVHNIIEPRWDNDLSPAEVISMIYSNDTTNDTATDTIATHIDRITYAQLEYPIIINSNYDVLDGCHRLAKHYILKTSMITCLMLTRDDLRGLGRYV